MIRWILIMGAMEFMHRFVPGGDVIVALAVAGLVVWTIAESDLRRRS